MAKIKLNLGKLSVVQRIEFAQQVIDAMGASPHFPAPNPTLADLQTLVDTATTAKNDALAAQQNAQMKTTERNMAVDALVAGLNAEAAYVESASGGDTAKIQSAAMDVRATGAPMGPVAQPQNCAATAGDNDGELDATWDSVRGAKSYEVQTSPEPMTATSWVHRTSVTASSVKLSGLPSATRCWVRVRAIGAAGPGPWSDPATKTVP
ncbi:MAG: fibronectin type III domain-containing protein [Verrucomicrobia bacterium]|nr:fibronectin type III domain-containing protein [Verrucomicrobiota bacterium]